MQVSGDMEAMASRGTTSDLDDVVHVHVVVLDVGREAVE